MPFFSIIVPVYNVEPYLKECLESVRTQTFADWECLCIEDGSPDYCSTILDEYAHRDARFHIFHQHNAGLSAARNRALPHATGTYITCLDSDDYLLPNALATYHSHLMPDLPDILRVNATTTAETLTPLLSDLPDSKTLHSHDTIDRETFASILIHGNPFLNIYRRVTFQTLLFNETLHFGEDLDFSLRLWFAATSARLVNVCDYYYRQHRGSMCHQKPTFAWYAPLVTMVDEAYQCLLARYADVPFDRHTFISTGTYFLADLSRYLKLYHWPKAHQQAFRQKLLQCQRHGILDPTLLPYTRRLPLNLYLDKGWSWPYRFLKNLHRFITQQLALPHTGQRLE